MIDQDTYDAAYATVVILDQRLRYKTYYDNTGRRIHNVSDLVNCLIDGRLDPAELDRRGAAKIEEIS